jgi:hypothetical protein
MSPSVAVEGFYKSITSSFYRTKRDLQHVEAKILLLAHENEWDKVCENDGNFLIYGE